MSIRSERDAYRAMAIHMALALTSIAVCVAVSVAIYITHNAWCLLGLLVIGMAYSVLSDDSSPAQTTNEEERA